MLETARNYLNYYRSRFRSDSLETSLSDNTDYPAFCAQAAVDEEVFSTFRSSTAYSAILEHVSFSLGRRYLQCIERDPGLLEQARRICDSDTIGSPTKYVYSGFGKASPTTLRYLKVAGDLKWEFGSLDGWNIVEIGVGYGGQCRVLTELYEVGTYTLIDLPEVLNLSERYLGGARATKALNFVSAYDVNRIPADLVISNYAFSELRRAVQERYVECIVGDASRGYMTYNQISPRSFNSLTAVELARSVRGSVKPERPRSYPGNQIVTWNNADG